ncbi:hypothetical protein GCM10009775_02660 [Microbacterium aoyamense]|uniref:Transglycosylase SLT domain-containing protein n=1 Tax=Microbacterium aoyamense TaxID=344166 RepID=A0ABN2P7R7_9MICO
MTPATAQPLAVRAAPVSPRVAPAAPTRWSRRRSVLGVFAAFAAMGFVVAYVGPTGMSISQASADEQTSLFASGLDDVQSREVPADAEPAVAAEFARDGYEVYVKPKPAPVVVKKTPTVAFAPPQYTGGGSPAEWMAAAGIAESDWGYVDYIVGRESGWNPNATNRSSGACGLVQVYPCSKLANAYDPVVNLGWANNYANGRYGSWAGAYNFWITNHWW